MQKWKCAIRYCIFKFQNCGLFLRNVFIYIYILLPLKVNKKHNYQLDRYNLSEFLLNTGKLSSEEVFLNNVSLNLSIIIPAYNAAMYIEECVDSIVSQNIKYSYEIIIIDDGSTDGTWDILQKYADIPNIVMKQQANAGQSAARNNAISVARGKYIMFVDSDDVLLPDSISKLMSAAEKYDADIAEGSLVKFYKEITDEMINDSKQKFHIESYNKNRKFVLSGVGYSVAKVYRRELWTAVRFPEGYIFEDIITKFILRRKANKVVFIGDVVYGYRQHNASSSHGSNQLKKLDSIFVLPKIIELCKITDSPFDDIFYLLCLNHIGLLNRITTKSQSNEIQYACFCEMKKQLQDIRQYRPKRLPFFFNLLEKTILEGNYDGWIQVADTIHKYGLLKKYREIN